MEATLQDASGRMLAGAVVTLRNTETGAVVTVVTGRSGLIRIDHLPPGLYRLVVERPGYLTRAETLTVEHGEPSVLRWALSVDEPVGTLPAPGSVGAFSQGGSKAGSKTQPPVRSGAPLVPQPSGFFPDLLRFDTARNPAGTPVNTPQSGSAVNLPRVPGATVEVTASALDAGLRAVGIDGPAAGAAESTVGPAQIDGLPVAARRWQSFAELVSGVLADAAGPGTFSLRGLPVTQSATEIDGLSADQSYSNTARGTGVIESETAGADASSPSATEALDSPYGQGGRYGRRPGAAYIFAQGAVREFRLQGQTTSALYGGGPGGLITTVTRMGGDHLHGSGEFYLRESSFSARDPYALAQHYLNGMASEQLAQPHDLRQQASATVGGPLARGVWRQRAFGFYAFDLTRRGFDAVAAPVTPGFFALTATQQALLANRGVTAAQTRAALTYLEGLGGDIARRNDQTIHFARGDIFLRPSTQLSVAYNRARWSSPRGLASSPVVPRGRASIGSATGAVDTTLGRWSQSFGRHLANELRGQYSHDLEAQQADAPLPQEPAISPGGLAPEVLIAPDGFQYGTPATLGRSAYPDETRLQVADTVAIATAHHLVQIGGDWSQIHDRVAALENSAGTFSYDSGTTGGKAGGLVDWVTDYTYNVHAYPNGGCPSVNAPTHYFCFHSYTQSFGAQQVEFSRQDSAAFAQEQWRAHPRLLLTAGARYEYGLLPLPRTPNAALDAVFGGTNSMSLPGFGQTGRIPEDRNNVAPRVGVSWEAARGLTFRAGYGFYYGRVPGATLRAALTQTALPSSTTRIRITPTVETACPQVANQGFGYPCAFMAAPVGVAAVSATTSAAVFDRRFRLPMVQQGSFTAEQALGEHGALELTYLVNVDRQLPHSTDLNIAPSTSDIAFMLSGGPANPRLGAQPGETFHVPLYTARVSSSFGPVTDILSNGGGTYHGGIVALRGRIRALGLSGEASYTYARALDYGGTQGATPRQDGQFDPFHVGYDKAISLLDRRQRATGHLLWSPAIATRGNGVRRVAARMGNGWSVSAVATAQTGAPYSYMVAYGSYLSGGHESLNGSGGATYLPTVGRNTLRLPPMIRTELRVARAVTLPEHLRAQVFVQAFNLTNRRNLTAVEQRAYLVGTVSNGVTPLVFQDAGAIAAEGLTTQAFGAALSSSTATSGQRELEFGVRVTF